MNVDSIKFWIDTQCDPTEEQMDRIRAMPFFDETDDWGDGLRVGFYTTNPAEILTTQQRLAKILGVLL